MKLTPEQLRQVGEHYLQEDDTANAIAALRVASDAGDALATVFLALFVRDDTVLSTAAVAREAPHGLECWDRALDREYQDSPPKPIRARNLKRMLAAYTAMPTTTTKVKEPA